MKCEWWLTERQIQTVEEFRERHRTAVFALLFTDIENSSGLRAEMGDVPAAELIERHNQLIRDLLAEFPEAEEISTAGDSFFLVFAKPSDATRFALTAQLRLRAFAEKERPDFRVNIGIDLGEVVVEEEARDGAVRDVLGMQVDIASRVADLAAGGQILMTRGVFDNARQILKGEMLPGIGDLSWVSHGPYLLKGFEEPLTVCEVGESVIAPLRPPPDCQSGKRATMIGTEPILGWRPAVEQQVPDTQWVLEAKLGEGGFGEVWRARHLKTKFTRVFKFCFRADRLRSLKREMTLFRILKETLGDRPDIARLYSVQFEEAPYYLEIEDTPGGNLAEWIEGQGGFDNVPMELRLDIVAQIATALSAAHSVGVIHRDVKPSNVLVEEVGRVRLTDFGIGQVADREALERAKITETGMTEMIAAMTELSSRTGTRMYMAPELTAGRPPSVQSDIYSLGVLLYQMVIGDLSQPMTTDWERRIEDPVLREDLRRCLAGEPSERFTGAAEIAHHLRALPQRRAELAEREAAERAAARRRKIAMVFACSTGLFVLLAITLGVGLLQALREKQRTEYELYINTIANADKCIDELRYDEARSLLADCPKKYRNWEWGRLQYRCNLDLMTLKGHTGWVTSIAFSPDGKYLATASYDRTARLWDVQTGDVVTTFTGHTAAVYRLAFSPDGKYIATAGYDNTAKIWDIETGSTSATLTGHSKKVNGVAFSPDGTRLATVSFDGTVRLWDVKTGDETTTFSSTTGLCVTFSPDGKYLAAGGFGEAAGVWDSETGRELHALYGHVEGAFSVAFTPDGRRLATGDMVGTVRFWDVKTGEMMTSFTGHAAEVWDIAFSPDGRRFATACGDNTAKIWDVQTSQVLRTFKGHGSVVLAVAFSPDGTRLATGSVDGSVKLWAMETQRDFLVLEPNEVIWGWAVAFSPDDKALATVSDYGLIGLWDPETGLRVRALGIPGAWEHSLAFSPRNPTILAAGSSNGSVGLWNVETKQRLLSRNAHSGWSSVAFSPNGTRLATAGGGRWVWGAGGDRIAKIWDVRTGSQVSSLAGHTDRVNCVAFSPDGKHVATGSWDDTARLWNPGTGKELERFEGFSGGVHSMAFSPNGRLLAAGDGVGTVRIWEVKTGRALPPFSGRGYMVHCLAFSPDGKRLAVAIHDKTARLWDVETAREILSLKGHQRALLSIAFSPDGRRLATGSIDKTAILWPTFPWNEEEYPGDAAMPPADRIELYKREYWKKYFAALKPGVSSAKRIVDASTFSPGLPVDVKLELVWNGDKTSVTVVENVPAGWMIDGVSRGQVQGNKIAWEIEPWTSPGATLEYTATPPATASDLPAVFGNAFFKVDSGYPSPIEDTSILPLMPPGVWILQQGSSPGPECCKDAHILLHKKFRNNNAGGCEALGEGDWTGRAVEHVKILIQFDLSSVPSTFTLGRGELRLYAYGEYKLGRRNEHTIYAAPLLRSWGEGEVQDPEGIRDGQNIPPQKGDVTANSPKHGELSWDIPGALGVNDVADAESSATVGVNWPEWVLLDVTKSVRYFLENPDKNYGWKISQDDKRGVDDSTIEYVAGTYMYKSSEAPEVPLRPMLVLVPAETINGE